MVSKHGTTGLAVAIALTVTGCVSSMQIGIGDIPPDGTVTLTLLDGDEFKMRHASVEADSVRGQIQRSGRLGGPIWADTIALPTSDIETVEIAESDGAATAGLIVAIVAIPALMFVAACSESDGMVC